MKIIYVGKQRKAAAEWADSTDDILLLHHDNWDDFGHKTRFPTTFIHQGAEVEVGAIRILFEGEQRSHDFLQVKLAEGWNGEFPIRDKNYVSVPEEITFYEQIASFLSRQGLEQVALDLRDASYLTYALEDQSALALIQTPDFSTSLQRERGSQKAFTDGWRLLAGGTFGVTDFNFQFRDVFSELATLELAYESDDVLPRDINVVIGANGAGKTSMLRQLVHAWIESDEYHEALEGAKFFPKPNLSQLVAVSYSPFERLPVDIREQNIQHPLKDQDVYRFFGFRGREGELSGSKSGRIRNNVSVPKANAARSLLRCVTDDRRYATMKTWANKLETLRNVLSSAIDFDYPALRLQPGAPEGEILVEHYFSGTTIVDAGTDDDSGRYVPINNHVLNDVNIDLLAHHLDADDGVTFFKDDQPILLSSGQRLFFYIVVNVLGAIRRNSLIVVDEPELFLHPTLEIQYLSMLKKVLNIYASKALVATHSVLIVREVPTECVHIMERADNELIIKRPPFETFGGDVQRIASYVFGDSAASKPHERWLRMLLESYGSAQAVIEALGDDINEEIIIQLYAMEQE